MIVAQGEPLGMLPLKWLSPVGAKYSALQFVVTTMCNPSGAASKIPGISRTGVLGYVLLPLRVFSFEKFGLAVLAGTGDFQLERLSGRLRMPARDMDIVITCELPLGTSMSHPY